MDIALKNVTRFKTIMYELSKGEDYRLIRGYQDSSELILAIQTFKINYILIDNWEECFSGVGKEFTVNKKMVQALEFGNGYVISSHTSLGVWLFIHGGIEISPL